MFFLTIPNKRGTNSILVQEIGSTTSQASEVVWNDVALSKRNAATKRLYWSGDCPLRKLFKKVRVCWDGMRWTSAGGTIEFWYRNNPALLCYGSIDISLCDLCGLTYDLHTNCHVPRSFPCSSYLWQKQQAYYVPASICSVPPLAPWDGTHFNLRLSEIWRSALTSINETSLKKSPEVTKLTLLMMVGSVKRSIQTVIQPFPNFP